ncbi:MAG: Rpn family recombination-promoting nuclease/putative transposase [Treponema sp.]|nr:Rpn family recombination-promoting nuclease/putative transposase [Treponema sp.]
MENQTHTENRKHKDSLFVDYFSKDRDWKQHFLSLYNALHGTNLQVDNTRLERVNLEQVLYMDYYNDIAIMVNDQFILMIEHQATINPNMPLRLLEYVTRIYGNKVDSKAKFSDKLIPLAKPEFFVFYTGNQDLPPESYLYLSDAFPKQDTSDEASLPGVLGAGAVSQGLNRDSLKSLCHSRLSGQKAVAPYPSGAGVLAASTQCVASSEGEVLGGQGARHRSPLPRFRVEGLPPPKEITLELVVKVCKIKGEEPSQIVQNCPDLEQYVQFLKLIDKAKADGQAQPLTRAIREAVRHNILRDYLERKGGETLSILTAEYDYATDIAVKQEEAYAIGLERGAYENKLETAKNLLSMNFTPTQVAQGTNLPLDVVQDLIEASGTSFH